MDDKSYEEPTEISVDLTSSEAIVLFELLSRWVADDNSPPGNDSFDHPSEWAVLQGVLTSLESQLVAPFREDYKKILSQAREAVSLDYSRFRLE
ncbi:hypothetical protein [Rhizobium sp. LCM 4573]|uniref:hypothetical protein n=1 Tax=Rhizobium sp. LCM 4573 TaxID=1848291 RepID=UPI0008D9F5ED|nr:hypothetical protein [Rhizobium sp. LCM 4573]OHV82775.1 hypothetical protein LCM4573_17510 [Rhizobium sp. LCM 4573]